MSKFNRREFLKLSAIWGVVPLIPKWLSFREDVPGEEEPEEDMSSPWHDEHCDSPYFCDGGTSVRYWDNGNVEFFVKGY